MSLNILVTFTDAGGPHFRFRLSSLCLWLHKHSNFSFFPWRTPKVIKRHKYNERLKDVSLMYRTKFICLLLFFLAVETGETSWKPIADLKPLRSSQQHQPRSTSYPNLPLSQGSDRTLSLKSVEELELHVMCGFVRLLSFPILQTSMKTSAQITFWIFFLTGSGGVGFAAPSMTMEVEARTSFYSVCLVISPSSKVSLFILKLLASIDESTLTFASYRKLHTGEPPLLGTRLLLSVIMRPFHAESR